MTNEEIKLLKNFITWQSLPFVDNLFTHEDEIIKKFDEWLRLNVGSNEGMTNEKAKVILTEYLDMDSEVKSEYLEAMRMAIKAIDKISHLIDRPCEACEFHKDNGCCKWSCVFEEVNANEGRY